MRNPSRFLFSLLTVLATAVPAGAQAQVSAQRIERAASEPQNWLTNHGGYDSKRYSTLTEITPANVKDLTLKWVWQNRSLEKFEATPLVVDGIMYTVQPPNDVVALDAATGRVFWTYQNDGNEGYFYALNARNGNVLWKSTVGGSVQSSPITYHGERAAVRIGECR